MASSKLYLKKSTLNVREGLVNLIAEGYHIHNEIDAFPKKDDLEESYKIWRQQAIDFLSQAFPTMMEAGEFITTMAQEYRCSRDYSQVLDKVIFQIRCKTEILRNILNTFEQHYTYKEDRSRIYINDIDSFAEVRNVNHQQIDQYLNNGFLSEPEDNVKRAFANIIGEKYVPKDWAGETEDLLTSRIMLNGERVEVALAFKGPGATRSSKITHTKDYGHNGDQLQRLTANTTSQLYIIQSVKPIGSDVVKIVDALIEQKRNKGEDCHYCIVDGQDTASIMFAYGYLNGMAAHQ